MRTRRPSHVGSDRLDSGSTTNRGGRRGRSHAAAATSSAPVYGFIGEQVRKRPASDLEVSEIGATSRPVGQPLERDEVREVTDRRLGAVDQHAVRGVRDLAVGERACTLGHDVQQAERRQRADLVLAVKQTVRQRAAVLAGRAELRQHRGDARAAASRVRREDLEVMGRAHDAIGDDGETADDDVPQAGAARSARPTAALAETLIAPWARCAATR